MRLHDRVGAGPQRVDFLGPLPIFFVTQRSTLGAKPHLSLVRQKNFRFEAVKRLKKISRDSRLTKNSRPASRQIRSSGRLL